MVNYSEAISKAAYYQKEAFLWGAKDSKIYGKSAREYAKIAEAWYKVAALLKVKGARWVDEKRGIPYISLKMSYSYPGQDS